MIDFYSATESFMFNKLVGEIAKIGMEWHGDDIVENTRTNAQYIEKTIDHLPTTSQQDKAIVVSAGPSLHYTGTLKALAESDFDGPIVAIDGSYVKCLRAGLVPDYLLTLDPHPTRLVRWFGDPDFEQNMEGDDYFSRQDLDVDFRNNTTRQNQENIDLVNKYAAKSKLIIASTAPRNVVARCREAGFPMYWWIPLVDDPNDENGLTRAMFSAASGGVPALNTGGNVGSAAWVFAKFWLECAKVAVIGMDLGYKNDLPYNMTQGYPELAHMLGGENVTDEYFPKMSNPLTGEVFYTDPTYFWYRKNLLEMIENTSETLYNCTEGGVLFGDGVENMYLSDFLNME